MKISDQQSINAIPSTLDAFQAKSGSSDKFVVFHAAKMENKTLVGVVEIGTVVVQMSSKKAHDLYVKTILKIVFTIGIALIFASTRDDLSLSKTRKLNEKIFLDLSYCQEGKLPESIAEAQDLMKQKVDEQQTRQAKIINERLDLQIDVYGQKGLDVGALIKEDALNQGSMKGFKECILENTQDPDPSYDLQTANDIIRDFTPLVKEYIDGIEAAVGFNPYVG